MRVLVVPKWYPRPDWPVSGIFCREQAHALALHPDVVVLASEAVWSPAFAMYRLNDAVEDGLRTLRVRYRRPVFGAAALGCQIAGMLAALRRLRREAWRPDIVHAHAYSAGLPSLILGRLSGAKVVVSEHDIGFQRGLMGRERFKAQIAFRYADLVAPVSRDLARRVRAITRHANVSVVENVVDTDIFHPPTQKREQKPDGSARLLTVARLAASKGHAHLLAALADLRRKRNLTLDLVGDGQVRGELQRLTRELGLTEVVRFHGDRPKQEVAEFMREADLFVRPSLYENLPCALIEALASGLPSVATAVGGVSELLDGTGGCLCPPGDPDALAAAIIHVLDGRADIDSEALAVRARQRFGYGAFAQTWTHLYRELRNPRPLRSANEPVIE